MWTSSGFDRIVAAVSPRWLHGASVALLALAAAACTPAYNWREVAPDGAALRVMLPAKPASMAREIDLDGLPVTMTMHGARADEQTFVVAWVPLPDADPATGERAVAAMAAGMLRNIGAGADGAVERTERRLPLVDPRGARVGEQVALELIAGGTKPAPGTTLHAVFVARGARAWQAVALGTPLDADAAKTFVDSFALVTTGSGR
jgi:hypothetical protein